MLRRQLVIAAVAVFLVAGHAAARETYMGAVRWAEGASEAELIGALRDDDIRWNAHAAINELRERGYGAVPALEKALGSDDWQQRQMAAELLRRIDGYVPSDRMFVVCVEGLADDALPWGDSPRTFTHVDNAYGGVEYLIGHAEAAEGYLAAGLHSVDAQQRFFCAYALGMAGRSGYAGPICEALAPHLNDNNIIGDATLATRALYLTGDAVAPHLRAARKRADDQGLKAIELILLDLSDPPVSIDEMRERGAGTDLTCLVHDPAVQDVRIRGMQPYRVRWRE
ncbi:MAG: hypothetical protein H6813_06385 [Phycisphaeraceae bacterium]|nr:hypothetical protein [Phycisphaeraceae bacterium]MCB9848099.1 hypothetical protein [Phycisphaeraceae bacterium]